MFNNYTVTFRGNVGRPETHTLKSSVSDVLDMNAGDVLSLVLSDMSTCAIQQSSFNQITLVAADPALFVGNVDRRAVCHFREEATGEMIRVTIPDPVATYNSLPFTEFKDQGERVTAAGMNALAAALATATGKEIIALYGKVTQSE